MAGSHDKSNWILYETSDLDTEIAASRDDNVNKTTCPQSIMEKLVEGKNYTLTLQYHDADNDIWSDKGSIEFSTATSFVPPAPTFKFKMKDSITLNGIFKWWDNDQLKVYKNGELISIPDIFNSRIPLSSSGDIIEIVNESFIDNYPNFTFRDFVIRGNAYNLLSIEAPLPLIREANNGQAVTEFNGKFVDCTNLVSIPDEMFKYNPQIISFGGNASLKDVDHDDPETKGCFHGSTSLKSIPPNIFKYNVNVKYFGGKGSDGYYFDEGYFNGFNASGCFQNCGLESVPEDLFKYNVNVERFGGIGGKGPDPDGPGGSGGGCFENCTKLKQVPKALFKFNTNVISFGSYRQSFNPFDGDGHGVFSDCTNLIVNLDIGSTNVTSCSGFASGTASKGTVYVPSGSTTAQTFKSDSTANVNVIEE